MESADWLKLITWGNGREWIGTQHRWHYTLSSDGAESWCSFKRDIATGRKTHKPAQHPFSTAMIDAMKPLFERLADEAFLEGCKNCYTQNPNESLNHLIWSLAPKEQFVSNQKTSLAGLAVCIFNNGYAYLLSQLLEQCNLNYSYESIKRWQFLDMERVRDADYRSQEDRKVQRKIQRRIRCKKQDGFKHLEGMQYKSQHFHGTDANKN